MDYEKDSLCWSFAAFLTRGATTATWLSSLLRRRWRSRTAYENENNDDVVIGVRRDLLLRPDDFFFEDFDCCCSWSLSSTSASGCRFWPALGRPCFFDWDCSFAACCSSPSALRLSFWFFFEFFDLLGEREIEERELLLRPLLWPWLDDRDRSWGGLLFLRPSVAFLVGDRDRLCAGWLLFRPPDLLLLDERDRFCVWPCFFRPAEGFLLDDRDFFCGDWLLWRPPVDCERAVELVRLRPPAAWAGLPDLDREREREASSVFLLRPPVWLPEDDDFCWLFFWKYKATFDSTPIR